MNRDDFKACREFAALDMIFNLCTLREYFSDSAKDASLSLFGETERGRYEEFVNRLLKSVYEAGDGEQADFSNLIDETVEPSLRSLRKENMSRMEFFTAVTDRLVAYEYVLNRAELRYAPEEELDEYLREHPEDAFLNRMIMYLTRGGDKRLFGTRLQAVVGEIPIQITKNKLFERIDRAFTLYLGSDETSIDELIYMLRMVGLAADADRYRAEYPPLSEALRDFEETDTTSMSEDEYNRLRNGIFSLSEKLQSVMDFYDGFQRCVNDLLAVCIVSRWLPEGEGIFKEKERHTLAELLSGTGEPDSLVALEGRIEGLTMRLERIMSGVEAPDMNLWEEEEYQDVATLARLLSNSLYAQIDPLFIEEKQVTKELIREKEDVLFAELSASMKASPRPVRKAIIAKVLEKLPPFLRNQEEIEEYFRVNLFGCRDKAERCAVMAILLEMEAEEA